MSDLISQIKIFVRVAESGSFSAVASELKSSQPTVSRQVAALEEHLGCRLFHRTTRSLTLTHEGQVFYEQALPLLENFHEAMGVVGKLKDKPSGTLRLCCAGVFGRLHLLPRLAKFMDLYPDLTIDLHLRDDFTNLVEEGFDLSIRVGEVNEPNRIARKIGTTHRTVIASAEYIAQHGAPKTPHDLRNHECIIYSGLSAGAKWRFDTAHGPLDVPVSGRYAVSSTEGVRAAILQGLGIGYVPIWHFVDKEIEQGQLVSLLPDWNAQPQPISVVYASRRYLSPKIRAMIDYLICEFKNDPLLR